MKQKYDCRILTVTYNLPEVFVIASLRRCIGIRHRHDWFFHPKKKRYIPIPLSLSLSLWPLNNWSITEIVVIEIGNGNGNSQWFNNPEREWEFSHVDCWKARSWIVSDAMVMTRKTSSLFRWFIRVDRPKIRIFLCTKKHLFLTHNIIFEKNDIYILSLVLYFNHFFYI